MSHAIINCFTALEQGKGKGKGKKVHRFLSYLFTFKNRKVILEGGGLGERERGFPFLAPPISFYRNGTDCCF